MSWLLTTLVVGIFLSAIVFKAWFQHLVFQTAVIAPEDDNPVIRWCAEVTLPQYAKSFFSNRMKSFLDSGFQHVGYLDIRHRFVQTHESCFLYQDILVARFSISKESVYPAQSLLGMKSLLTDGTVVDTIYSNDSKTQPVLRDGLYVRNDVDTDQPLEMLRSHLAEVDRLTAGGDRTAAPMELGKVQELARYGLYVSDELLAI